MHQRTALLKAIENLSELQAKLSALSARDDDARRLDMVKLRRQLSEYLQIVRIAADEDKTLQNNPDLALEFRKRFSAMRSAIAFHQASWPAVSMDRNNFKYTESAANVGKLNRDFAAWVKTELINSSQSRNSGV